MPHVVVESHGLHSLAPLADHVPSSHARLLLSEHWNPGSHGQHVVMFGGSSPYSPGGHGEEEERRRRALVVVVVVETSSSGRKMIQDWNNNSSSCCGSWLIWVGWV